MAQMSNQFSKAGEQSSAFGVYSPYLTDRTTHDNKTITK
jgi:hypothetical protein